MLINSLKTVKIDQMLLWIYQFINWSKVLAVCVQIDRKSAIQIKIFYTFAVVSSFFFTLHRNIQFAVFTAENYDENWFEVKAV